MQLLLVARNIDIVLVGLICVAACDFPAANCSHWRCDFDLWIEPEKTLEFYDIEDEFNLDAQVG